MKIKSIIKYEDESRLINVNFVTSMIENSQVSIGMKYFIIEWYNKQSMGYDIGTALNEEKLVSQLHDCCYRMPEYKFKQLVDDIVRDTPKFCYVFDNIWKHVLEREYNMNSTVRDVEANLKSDINHYHGCKLYDLLNPKNRESFENKYPTKETTNVFDGSLHLTANYSALYDLLWKWFDSLTKGKYELVNNMLYNKAKKAEEKLSILKYKELSNEDLAEVCKFVDTQLIEKGFYHNTGNMHVTCGDGRKLSISDVNTLDLAAAIRNEVHMIGDYIYVSSSAAACLFKGSSVLTNPVHSEYISYLVKKAVTSDDYDATRFWEKNTPYGRLGYNATGRYWSDNVLFVVKENEKSIVLVDREHKDSSNEDDFNKRKLEKYGDVECFSWFKSTVKADRDSRFSRSALREEIERSAKNYYAEAVEKFGEPKLDEQEITENDLVKAASEAL